MFCPGMPQRLLKSLVSISNLIGSGPCTHVEFACCRFPIDLTSEEGKKDHLVDFPVCFPVSFHGIATMVQTWADVVLRLGSEKFRVTRMTWAYKRIVSFICSYLLTMVTALL